jgi:hypothetical protein
VSNINMFGSPRSVIRLYFSTEYAEWSLVSADDTISSQPSCHRGSLGSMSPSELVSFDEQVASASAFECLQIRFMDACGLGASAWEGCVVRSSLMADDDSTSSDVATVVLSTDLQQQQQRSLCPQGPGNYTLRAAPSADHGTCSTVSMTHIRK